MEDEQGYYERGKRGYEGAVEGGWLERMDGEDEVEKRRRGWNERDEKIDCRREWKNGMRRNSKRRRMRRGEMEWRWGEGR